MLPKQSIFWPATAPALSATAVMRCCRVDKRWSLLSVSTASLSASGLPTTMTSSLALVTAAITQHNAWQMLLACVSPYQLVQPEVVLCSTDSRLHQSCASPLTKAQHSMLVVTNSAGEFGHMSWSDPQTCNMLCSMGEWQQ